MIRVTGTIASWPPVVLMEEVTLSPVEQARAEARRAAYLANMAWASGHAAEIGRTCAGKYICVAGGELFAASTPAEAHAAAHAAHPTEVGASFSTYVPAKPRPKIYAN